MSGYQDLAPRVRRQGYAALAVSIVAIAGYCLIGVLGDRIRIDHIDLNVYRAGARVLLQGGNLYGTLPSAAPGLELPFTYPPFAAVLLTPLALLPAAIDSLLAIAMTALLLAFVTRLILRELGLQSTAVLNWAVLVAMPTALILDPVRVALTDGQIDVILMALVTADTLGRHRQRGWLVGLAAAVKLTPAVFVLYFLVRGDKRSALNAAASFAACTALGFLVAPGDSAEYWGHAVFQTNRIGSIWYAANQSLDAVLARTGLTGHALSITWLACCVLVLCLAWTTMRRSYAHRNIVGVLLINAIAELLISPISWTHHWVWIVPMLVALGVAASRGDMPRGLRTLSRVAFVLFALGPQWLLPHGADRELRWAWWEQILGGSYVWFALAVLITTAFAVDTMVGVRTTTRDQAMLILAEHG